MTELKEPPKKRRKATKEERKEASEVVHRLEETGEFKRLQEELLCKIMYEHPEWLDTMRQTVRDTVQPKPGGVLDITLDELSAALVKTGKEAVPEEIRQFMLEQIQTAMAPL